MCFSYLFSVIPGPWGSLYAWIAIPALRAGGCFCFAGGPLTSICLWQGLTLFEVSVAAGSTDWRSPCQLGTGIGDLIASWEQGCGGKAGVPETFS